MEPQTVTIELIKPHTDAGKDYLPGDQLTLSAQLAQWLIDIGSAKPASAKAKAWPE